MHPENTRPNILLIMPDQMRGDCLSLERHPTLLTPNMDAIGGQGAHFTRAYTTCASCIAARRSLLTGQHPATNGMVGYREGVPIETNTLTECLRDGGYQTAIAGRYMHQSPLSEPYGFETRVLGSTYKLDDDYARELDDAVPELGGIRGVGLSSNGWQARPWPVAEHLHPTHWTTQQSRRILTRAESERPLFLVTSFYAPHPPLCPPVFYMDRYLRNSLPPRSLGSWASPPPDGGRGAGVDAHEVDLCGEALRSAQAGYFGLINQIDDQLYWLTSEFRARSRETGRPWLIVLTSDHGEMLGDHYLFRKCEPYEGASRIPMLIQGSAELDLAPGVAYNGPVCLEDLMPTLLELADLPAPADLDGRSLVSVLRGGTDQLRPWLHGEHAPCYSNRQAYHFLTDGRHKYVWRPHDGSEQLFALEVDPYELHDLTQDREHTGSLAAWRKRLIDHLRDRPEGFSDGVRLLAGQPYRPWMGGRPV